jgi:Xaa-Pro aminopeptidase
MMTAENLGEQFDLEKYLEARTRTIKAVRETSKKILPGMSEKEARTLLTDELNSLGVEKFWHPTKLRMNVNSVKNFSETSVETTLEKDDIYFIDIGPVFLNHEGDYGETFVTGSDPALKHLRDATHTVFAAVAAVFKEKKLSGIDLYKFAEQKAFKLGLKLNSNMYGHRLGDFPHALHHRGDLGEFTEIPNANLWVLEIHLLDEKINRGAFFEDILF